jgi:hypothetical protein
MAEKNSPEDVRKKELQEEFLRIAKQTREDFQEGLKGCKHPGEVGRARERILVEFLERFIPEPFDIGTGFVVDRDGNKSGQIDLIIFDKTSSRGIGLKGDLMYYPCESVVAIGEVKTSIKSRKDLRDALDKIESVQKLNCHSKKTRKAFDYLPKELRIIGFVFTSDSMKQETIYKELENYCSSRPQRFWPNIIVDFEKYLISYYSEHPLFGLSLFPDMADQWYSTIPEASDRVILLFACYLVSQLASFKNKNTPDLLEYFGVKEIRAKMLGPVPKYASY